MKAYDRFLSRKMNISIKTKYEEILKIVDLPLQIKLDIT